MRRLIAVLAAAGAILLGLAVPGSAAPPAAKCVGLVVDFGGGSVQSTCVPYRSGMTGAQVLAAAGHKVTNKSGFLCQIDAHPSKCASDNTHYWGYYHRAAGTQKWNFSNTGATTYHVKPGETEGWAWVNGKTRPPKSVPYAQLQAAAAPKPSATASKPSATAAKSPASSAADKDNDNSGGGTPWGLIIGIVAVVVIVGAGVARLVARRS